jgi:hypothetical protein
VCAASGRPPLTGSPTARLADCPTRRMARELRGAVQNRDSSVRPAIRDAIEHVGGLAVDLWVPPVKGRSADASRLPPGSPLSAWTSPRLRVACKARPRSPRMKARTPEGETPKSEANRVTIVSSPTFHLTESARRVQSTPRAGGRTTWFGPNREPGVIPGLPRSGERERNPSMHWDLRELGSGGK